MSRVCRTGRELARRVGRVVCAGLALLAAPRNFDPDGGCWWAV